MEFEGIVRTVGSVGGIMRTRRLYELGVSKHRQATAVAGGALERVGRSWLALPGVDPRLVAAARAGVVLTCVTEAERRGLWVLEQDRPHVGAPPHGRVRITQAHVHWGVPALARDPNVLVDPIQNVLAIVASCQPHDAALAIWESALNGGLVTLDEMRRLPLGPAGRALCEEAVPWSDSGLHRWHEVQDVLIRAIAQGLHRAA